MGEVYAAFIFISVLFGTVVDKRYSAVLFLKELKIYGTKMPQESVVFQSYDALQSLQCE